jgi:cytochrome c oxidase cbb3-type subunit III
VGFFLKPIVARVIFFVLIPACTLMAEDGRELFDQHCALCHGIGGTGGRGPSLARPNLLHAPDDAALKKVISEGIQPEMPGVWLLDDDAVANLAAYVRSLGKVAVMPLPGDVAKGALVYAASGCAACHMLAGKGSSYGPDLTEIGARRSAAHLEESLLKPSAAMPEGFLLVRFRTADGHLIEGVRLNETNFTIHIKDSSGQIHSFLRSELASIEKLPGQTPMPAYDQSLARADIQNLVAWLASQRGSP